MLLEMFLTGVGVGVIFIHLIVITIHDINVTFISTKMKINKTEMMIFICTSQLRKKEASLRFC